MSSDEENESIIQDKSKIVVEKLPSARASKTAPMPIPKSITEQRKEMRLKNLENARQRLKELTEERKQRALAEAKAEEKKQKDEMRAKKNEIEKESVLNQMRDIKLMRDADSVDLKEEERPVRRPVRMDDLPPPINSISQHKKKQNVMKVVKIKYYTNQNDDDDFERQMFKGDDLETLAKIHKKEEKPVPIPPVNPFNHLFNY